MARTPIAADVRDGVLQSLKTGERALDIAEQFHISITSVYNIRHSRGNARKARTRNARPADLEKLYAVALAGERNHGKIPGSQAAVWAGAAKTKAMRRAIATLERRVSDLRRKIQPPESAGACALWTGAFSRTPLLVNITGGGYIRARKLLLQLIGESTYKDQLAPTCDKLCMSPSHWHISADRLKRSKPEPPHHRGRRRGAPWKAASNA